MMRYERKYRIEGIPFYEVMTWVESHPLAFREEYPQRQVNNVYLDTPELACLQDNLRGVSQRCKYRYRWYGPQVRGPITFEIKSRDGALGSKASYAQQNLDFRTLEGPFDLPYLTPTLRNHYQRAYFRSFDRRFRLTVDWGLRFQQESTRGPLGPEVSDPAIIVEVKYASEDDVYYDQMGQVWPFRWGKNSKYVTGMLLLT